MKDIATAYEHSEYDPDEITQLYSDLELGDVHRALAYYYDRRRLPFALVRAGLCTTPLQVPLESSGNRAAQQVDDLLDDWSDSEGWTLLSWG